MLRHLVRWILRSLLLLRGNAIGLLCSLFLLSSPVFAQLSVPLLSGHVVDNAAILETEQIQALESKLTVFEKKSGSQIVLLLIPTTQPEDIASYANRVANTWKIGRKEIGDGLLIVVAKNDHRVRIEVAKTLEGAIPDLAAKRIIDQAMSPRFKQADFQGGLNAGIDQIVRLITGESLPAPTPESSHDNGEFNWMNLLAFAFIAVPVVSSIARRILGLKLGSLATGAAVGGITLLISSSLFMASIAAMITLVFTLFSNHSRSAVSTRWGSGGSGWSSGSSGGDRGGFTSGGGGDFGGGGASGDW